MSQCQLNVTNVTLSQSQSLSHCGNYYRTGDRESEERPLGRGSEDYGLMGLVTWTPGLEI